MNIRLAAIDGSLHEVKLTDVNLAYVVVGAVFLRLTDDGIFYEGSKVVESVKENEKGDELMRRMEYELANSISREVDIIFMDRKLSMDKERGIAIPRNTVGIIKDFDRSKISLDEEKPWLMIEKQDEFITGYFKVFNWIFMFETNINDIKYVSYILYRLALEPIPEALGYNYALFLADKLVKYYRDKYVKTLDFIANKKISRYRSFRRIVENGRKSL